jgi:hypothetical protein
MPEKEEKRKPLCNHVLRRSTPVESLELFIALHIDNMWYLIIYHKIFINGCLSWVRVGLPEFSKGGSLLFCFSPSPVRLKNLNYVPDRGK